MCAFAASWPGDLARGIPATMPEAWVLGWYAVQRAWPKNWREKMAANFRSDWLAGFAKARKSGERRAESGGKSGGRTDGRTEAQARYELSKELEAVRERLDAAHETNIEPNAADVRREKEVERLLKELNQP